MKITNREYARIKAAFTLQQDQRDCGVACLLSLIRYHGGYQAPEQLRTLAGTGENGTSLSGLQEAAMQCGCTSDGFTATLEDLLEYGKPVILHVRLNPAEHVQLEHYWVFYGAYKHGYLVGDPAGEVQVLDAATIEAAWQTRACLTVEPAENFEPAQTFDKERRRWFVGLLAPDKQYLAIIIVLGLVVALLGLSMSMFSKKLVDDILPQYRLDKMVAACVVFVVLLIFREVLGFVRQQVQLLQTKAFNARINRFFFEKMLRLPRSFIQSRSLGEITARLHDINRVQRVIGQVSGAVIIDFLVTVAATTVIFTFSVKAGLIVLLAAPVFFLAVHRSNDTILHAQQAVMTGFSLTESGFISTLQGIGEIKGYNKQDEYTEKNAKVFGSYLDKGLVLGRVQAKLGLQVSVFVLTCTLLVLLITGSEAAVRLRPFGDVLAVLALLTTLFPSLVNLAVLRIPLSEARVAFQRIYDFARLQNEAPGGSAVETIEAIELRDTGFRYPGKKPLFSGVSASFKKGSIIGITGGNGQGKSTLGHLLCRNLQATAGSILLNGQIPITATDLFGWRRQVHRVEQAPHLFTGTVLDNILMGAPETMAPEAALQRLEELGLLPAFGSLPMNVFTQVGEGGNNLSGGQRQLTGIARALLHQPQVLICDEATSAMDTRTETLVLELLERLSPDMIILFITHNHTLVEHYCGRVYNVSKGVMVEVADVIM